MAAEQYVCTVCGFNMVGCHPAQGRKLAQACGVNYVMDYGDWLEQFNRGPAYAGY